MALTPMTDQIGRVLGGRYRLLAPIGAGASAQVYLTEDVRLRRRVAVKVLHESLADDEGFLKRLRAEARAVAQLRHPNILAVYDWSAGDERPYIVTEYLGGGSLRAMLDQGVRLTPAQALMIGLDASRALDHAHRRGFVHRDVTPSNLLFDEDGRLVIADFGVARALAEAAVTEPAGAMLGTARYASPEQARGEPVSGRSDLYSLALVLIEAVTGDVPFARDTPLGTLHARTAGPIPIPPELDMLAPALRTVTAVDPGDRVDAAQLAARLHALARDLDPPEPLPLAGAVALPELDERAGPDPTLLPGDLDVLPEEDPLVPPEPVPTGSAPEDGEEATGRFRRPLLLGLGAAAVALVVLAGIALFQVTRPEHEVPSLEALQVSQIDELVDSKGWDITRVVTRADDTRPGQILEQDPAPGEMLREGDRLTLTVSRGPTLVAVPDDLAGRSADEARTTLEEAGLTVGQVLRKHNELAPEGTVLATGNLFAQLPRGDAVPLVVSRGPRPRVVPDGLAGGTFDGAAAQLADVQLVAVRGEESSESVPEGVVIRTEPGPGAEVPRDSEVVVVVSTGPPLVEVPDVVGDIASDVADLLEGLGLEIAGVVGNPNRRVVDLDPGPGSLVEAGTDVTIYSRLLGGG